MEEFISTSGSRRLRRAVVVAGAAGFLVGVELATYRYWRSRCLTWGASSDEIDAQLPGDELLESPTIVTTRAITIDAPPERVWPWLAQLGPDKGGVYTYDWIENALGLNVHSVDRIVPEYQHIEVGDAQKLGKRGPVLRVAALDPGRTLTLKSDDGHWVWSFNLVPMGASTRVVSRNRIDASDAKLTGRAFNRYVMEPGSLVMERKMLKGIKQRAESAAVPEAQEVTSGAK